jgi:hypothetical protein
MVHNDNLDRTVTGQGSTLYPSHIESLNIKRNIDKTYSCFVRYNMENRMNLILTDE